MGYLIGPMTENILSFIYKKKEEEEEHIRPEIVPDRNYKNMNFTDLLAYLNIKNYREEFSSAKNIYEFLSEFNEKIFQFDLKIDQLANINKEDIANDDKKELIEQCDILEINIEKKRKRVENYKRSFEVRIEELIENLKNLEEQPEIKYKDYLYNIIKHMGRKEYHLIPELYETEFFNNFLNKKNMKILKQKL